MAAAPDTGKVFVSMRLKPFIPIPVFAGLVGAVFLAFVIFAGKHGLKGGLVCAGFLAILGGVGYLGESRMQLAKVCEHGLLVRKLGRYELVAWNDVTSLQLNEGSGKARFHRIIFADGRKLGMVAGIHGSTHNREVLAIVEQQLRARGRVASR